MEFSGFEDFVSEIPSEISTSEIEEIKQNDKYAFYRQIAEELRNCNYLDCSMKYSGLKNIEINYNAEQSTITATQAIFDNDDINKRIGINPLQAMNTAFFISMKL